MFTSGLGLRLYWRSDLGYAACPVSGDYLQFRSIGRNGDMSFLVALAVVALAQAAQDQPADNMDILRDKIKADKKLLIAENLGLPDAESKAFWPIYDEYQKELAGLNQRLGKMSPGYAKDE